MSQMNIWHEFIYLLENFYIVLRNNSIGNNSTKKLNELSTIFRIMVTLQGGNRKEALRVLLDSRKFHLLAWAEGAQFLKLLLILSLLFFMQALLFILYKQIYFFKWYILKANEIYYVHNWSYWKEKQNRTHTKIRS